MPRACQGDAGCAGGALRGDGAGRYIKIAEKGRYRPKSSIVVPLSGLAPFLQVLKCFLNEATASRSVATDAPGAVVEESGHANPRTPTDGPPLACRCLAG